MALNENHYILPGEPETQWWLPPPCQEPRLREHKRRFFTIVRYMIQQRLRDVALPYEILDILVMSDLSCKRKTKCWYEITFDLGPDYQHIDDAKRAVNDLRMHVPRGLQEVCAKVRRHDLQDGGNNVPRTTLQVSYTPNCQHNVRWRGNCRIRHSIFPKVAVDDLRLQVDNLVAEDDDGPVQSLTPGSFVVPQRPVTEWWIPPPCVVNLESAVARSKFNELIKFVLQKNLYSGGRLTYSVRKISIPETLSCKYLTKCWYQVEWNLGNDFNTKDDAKRAVHDIKIFRPLGLQLVESKCRTRSAEDGTQSFLLRVLYTLNCRHNVRYMGNGAILLDRYPRAN